MPDPATPSGGAVSPLVRMEGIVKDFPGVRANDHIDFELRAGEVHALLGENGAGKTTLMNILYGLYQADAGRIFVRGRQVSIRAPSDAVRLGIGMVHQHLKLVESHTVAENVILGLKEQFVLRMDVVRRRISELAGRYGLRIEPDARVWQLSMGERQRVELVKILYRDSEILLLDEPTSLLAPQEVGELFAALRRMASEGRGVVLITHKLEEVMRVSDRVTVLRQGRVVAMKHARETGPEELATLMVGRPVLFQLQKTSSSQSKVVLEVRELSMMGDRGVLAVRNVSFDLREGEIFGLVGVAGSGQRELAQAITALRRPVSGTIRILGQERTHVSPRAVLEAGVAYVPEDRVGMGAVPGLTVAENLVLRRYRYQPHSSRFWLRRSQIRESARQLIDQFGIATPDEENATRNLSGGNLQKLIIARELASQPKLLVAEHPTRGLDVGATEYVRSLLLKARERGTAVLLISEDLDEILSLCDRVAVMYNGEFMGIMQTAEAEIGNLGLMMTGALRLEAPVVAV